MSDINKKKMKENANDKRVSLITEVINLSDEQILGTTLVSEPDATTESHETGHPPNPPPDPPPGGGNG